MNLVEQRSLKLQKASTGPCSAVGMCLIADTCLTVDPGVASLITARSHTFVELDNEIISRANLLASADSRRVVISYKRKSVHEVLVQACTGNKSLVT